MTLVLLFAIVCLVCYVATAIYLAIPQRTSFGLNFFAIVFLLGFLASLITCALVVYDYWSSNS